MNGRIEVTAAALGIALLGLPGAPALAAAESESADRGNWSPLLRIDLAEGFEPVAAALDESGNIHVLETAPAKDGRCDARIRTWATGKTGPGTVFADGFEVAADCCHQSLWAWQGRLFLADLPAIRGFNDGNGDGKADQWWELPARFRASDAGPAGFGGLGIGPDGRIYGGFGGGTVSSSGFETHGGVAFRFEPDGSGFEIIQRGLGTAATPMFDDLGRAALISRNAGGLLMPADLLDGGTGLHQRRAWQGITLGCAPLGPSCLLDPAGTGGMALVGPPGGKRLAWWRAGKNGRTTGVLDPGKLLEQTDLIDLTADWNGRPHLLIRRHGKGDAADRFEIHAWGQAPSKTAETAVVMTKIARFLSDSAAGDATELFDLLRHPERRVRLTAQLALSRRGEAFAVLIHAGGSGDIRSQLHAIRGLGILARRGGGSIAPGDAIDFSALANEQIARRAALSIAPALEHRDPRIRVAALQTMSAGRRAAGLIQFSKMIDDPKPEVRREALLAAARMRWQALVSALTGRAPGKALPDLDPARLADVLERGHAPGQLRIYASQANPMLKLAAVEALRRSADPGLAAFTIDQDPAIAGAAIRAIDRAEVKEAMRVAARRINQDWPAEWDTETRRAALRCAAQAEDARNFTERFSSLAQDGGPVGAEALAAIIRIAPQQAADEISKALESSDIELLQAAWPLVTKLPEESARELIESGLEKLSSGPGVKADALELVTAARHFDDPEWKLQIQAWEKSTAAGAAGLSEHSVTLAGGDPKRGQNLFADAAHCGSCHDKAGDSKDPVARLKAIVRPEHGKAMGPMLVEFNDGSRTAGLRISASDELIELRTAAGLVGIKTSSIARQTESSGLTPEPALTTRDIRDLMAWLEQTAGK